MVWLCLKKEFPNPLVKIAGIGDFFKKGTLLGKFLSSLNKSDQNKVGTDAITNDPQGVKQGPPAYDVNQYGLGNMDILIKLFVILITQG